ncbi:hypothetical protein ACFW1A_31825, partial [Kitasatospora sp. NPDC058965]
SLVRVHFADRAVSSTVVGVLEPFHQAFLSTLAALDRTLADLAPAPVDFPAPQIWSSKRSSDVAERGHAVGQRLVTGAVSMFSGRLSGEPRSGGPSGWASISHVQFVSDAGTAVLEMPAVVALLAIPALIGSETPPAGGAPSLPEALRAKTLELAVLIETGLPQGGYGVQTVAIPDEHRLTFQFLHQQAAIRSRLPVRTLCTCRDCKHQKVVNLDLKRLRTKNRNLKMLVSVLGVSGVAGGHGDPNPFQVFSTVFRQAKLEPDFICSRCESTEADERPVTFCPSCGDQRAEAVLLSCAKCKHDFRTAVQGERIWHDTPPLPPTPPTSVVPPAPAAVPGFSPAPAPYRPPVPVPPQPQPYPAAVPLQPYPGAVPPPLPPTAPPPYNPYAQPAAPAHGRRCTICGMSYPVLWSVQVFQHGAWQPMTVCATTPRCSPPSRVRPVQV